jgi:hypothetical protein
LGQGFLSQRTLSGWVFWHFTVSVTPEEMFAHAPSVADLKAVISEEAPAVVQAVWPLNVMQTRTLYVSRPMVE